MARDDSSGRRTPLQLALERGLQPGGELDHEVRRLGEFSVESRDEAEAIGEALDRVIEAPGLGGESALHTLTGLFQDVESTECPAFEELWESGTGRLTRVVDSALAGDACWNPDHVLFALKILVLYGTSEGLDTVIRAARLPFKPDRFMWTIILRPYGEAHPYAESVFEALSNPLPEGMIAVALLRAANASLIGGGEHRHPFDTPAGHSMLDAWLTETDAEELGRAVDAAVAAAFISPPARDLLLALALDHPDVGVQMEAAWAAGRLGREAGINLLAGYCRDINHSKAASRYLKELGREDAIPAEASDPDFMARAEFAQWLAHPNELGRAPDEVRVVDKRVLAWPSEREPRPFWLLEYRLRDPDRLKEDEVDVGLVGSTTFCLFSYKIGERPPEDGYAIHCVWELEGEGLIAEDKVEDPAEYEHMKAHWIGPRADQMTIRRVAEVSPELNYPQRLVALAQAEIDGAQGLIVLDGQRSRWYPSYEMPDASDGIVLKLHIGRELLGFRDQPQRTRFLRPPPAPRPPEEIVAAYGRLLEKARNEPAERGRLLGESVNSSPLGKFFDTYVAALAATRGISAAAATASAYESMLAAVSSEPVPSAELFAEDTPLLCRFGDYAAALTDLGRRAELPALIESFHPRWDFDQGRAILGEAAFKAGFDDLAEPMLKSLITAERDWVRADSVAQLAEIYLRRGDIAAARTLMLREVRAALERSRTADEGDRSMRETWFQAYRSAYLRLFPERGDAELAEQGIPASTVASTD